MAADWSVSEVGCSRTLKRSVDGGLWLVEPASDVDSSP